MDLWGRYSNNEGWRSRKRRERGMDVIEMFDVRVNPEDLLIAIPMYFQITSFGENTRAIRDRF
jgi:hypothetical protein